MRVVLIGPVYPYRGGIAHHTAMLARALAQKHEVQVVSFKRQYPHWLYPGASDKDPSQQPVQVDAAYLLDPVNPRSWLRTASHIAKFSPDVVVTQWWTTFWAMAYTSLFGLLRRRNLKLVYVIHNVIPHESKPWDRWLAMLALRQGHAFIAQGNRERDRLLALLPEARVSLCPHPIYDMFASQTMPKGDARRALGLSEHLPVALFFGIVRPYKGLGHLIEAISLLKAQGTTVQLVIAGEFWENTEQYRQLVEHHGLTGQTLIDDRYIPNEEIGKLFSAADVFVAPYEHGTQSGAAKIAMGFGLPIVLTEGIMDESLRTSGLNVLTVPASDSQALSEAIHVAITQSSPARAVSSIESWQSLVKAIEDIIASDYNTFAN